MSIEKRLPFDRTGVHPDNLVRRERHIITDQKRMFRVYYGAFYTASVEIVDEGGQDLKGKYRFSRMVEEVVKEVGLDAAGWIWFKDKSFTGVVYITYQAVGGEYATSSVNYDELIEASTRDHRAIHYEQITDQPDAIVPERHLHHMQDIYGAGPYFGQANAMLALITKYAIQRDHAFRQRLTAIEVRTRLIDTFDPEKLTSLEQEMREIRQQLNDNAGFIRREVYDEHLTQYGTFKTSTELALGNLQTAVAPVEGLLSAFSNFKQSTETMLTEHINELSKMTTVELVKSTTQVADGEQVALSYDQSNNRYQLTVHPIGLATHYTSQLHELNERIATNQTSLTTATAKLATHEQQLSTIDQKLLSLTNKDVQLQNEVDQLKETQLTQNTRLDNLAAEIGSSQADYSALRQTVSRNFEVHSEAIDNAKKGFAQDIGARIEGLKVEIATANQQQDEAFNNHKEEVAGQVSQISEKINTEKAAILRKTAEDLQEEKRALSGRIDTLSTKVGQNELKVSQQKTFNEETRSKIQQLEQTTIPNLDQRLSQATTTLVETKEKVDNIDMPAALERISAIETKLEEKASEDHAINGTTAERLDAINLKAGNALTTAQQAQAKAIEANEKATSIEAGLNSLIDTRSEAKVSPVRTTLNQHIASYNSKVMVLEAYDGQLNSKITALEATKLMVEEDINALKRTTRTTVTELNKTKAFIEETQASQFLLTRKSKAIQFKDINRNESIRFPEAGKMQFYKIVLDESAKQEVSKTNHKLTPIAQAVSIHENASDQPTVELIKGQLNSANHGFVVMMHYDVFTSIPILSHQDEENELIDNLLPFKIFKERTTEVVKLRNVFKGLYKGLVPGTSAIVGFVFNKGADSVDNFTCFLQYADYDFQQLILVNKKEEYATSYIRDDVATSLQYNGILSHYIHDLFLRDNDINVLYNDNLLLSVDEESLPGWDVKDANTQLPISQPTLKVVLKDREAELIKLANIVDYQFIPSEGIEILPNTNRRQFELSFSSSNPYVEVEVTGELIPAAGGVGTPVQFNSIRNYRLETTGPSSSVNASHGGLFRLKWVSSVIANQSTKQILKIKITPLNLTTQTAGAIGKFTFTELRGSSTYIPNKAFNPQEERLTEAERSKIQSEVRRYIAEQSAPTQASKWDLTKFKEQPGTEDWSNVSVDEHDNLTAQGVILVKYADSSETAVFAPTQTFYVTQTQEWSVPATLVGRKALIRVRGKSIRQNGKILNSAVRELYVVLKQEKVRITIGELSSFGNYLSTNTQIVYPDAVYPRFFSEDVPSEPLTDGLVSIVV